MDRRGRGGGAQPGPGLHIATNFGIDYPPAALCVEVGDSQMETSRLGGWDEISKVDKSYCGIDSDEMLHGKKLGKGIRQKDGEMVSSYQLKAAK